MPQSQRLGFPRVDVRTEREREIRGVAPLAMMYCSANKRPPQQELSAWGLGCNLGAVGVRACSTHGDCERAVQGGAEAATAPAQHCLAPPGARWQPSPPQRPHARGQHTTPRGPALLSPPYAVHVAPCPSSAAACRPPTRTPSTSQLQPRAVSPRMGPGRPQSRARQHVHVVARALPCVHHL